MQNWDSVQFQSQLLAAGEIGDYNPMLSELTTLNLI